MIDLHLGALLAQIRAAGAPDLCELPIPAARGLYAQIMSVSGGHDAAADAQDLPCDIGPALRCYRPRGPGPHPVVLYIHGGGYVLGTLDDYDGVCRQLAADAQAVVVSVGYRLAPEHALATAFDDAAAALRWVVSEPGRAALGPAADPTRLALAGDSGGAVLAVAAAIGARDAGGPAIRSMALAYPPAAGARDGAFPSRRQHAAGPTLTAATMDYFYRHAVGESVPDPRLAPLFAPDLARLPPTMLLVAGLDPLRDEALAFGAALLEAGVTTTVVEYHGLAHGFLGMGAAVPSARQAQWLMAQALRTALA